MESAQTLRVARCEFKYLLAPERLPALERFLLRYCVPDAYSRDGAWYPISSLYLDNDEWRFYRDTEDSVPWRCKLRARRYGDGGAVKLEVKRRAKDIVRKTSASLSESAWSDAAPGGLGSIADRAGQRAGEFVTLAESFRAAPKMLVQYERKAFTSLVDDYVRVTVDRRMRAQRVRAWDLAGDPRAWRAVDDPESIGEPRSLYVLELKFVVTPPAWLRDLTAEFGLVRRGYSKYGRAVRREVVAREQAWDLRPAGWRHAWTWA